MLTSQVVCSFRWGVIEAIFQDDQRLLSVKIGNHQVNSLAGAGCSGQAEEKRIELWGHLDLWGSYTAEEFCVFISFKQCNLNSYCMLHCSLYSLAKIIAFFLFFFKAWWIRLFFFFLLFKSGIALKHWWLFKLLAELVPGPIGACEIILLNTVSAFGGCWCCLLVYGLGHLLRAIRVWPATADP